MDINEIIYQIQGAVFSEKDVPEPQDPYGISKLEEQVLRDVAADTGMAVDL